FLLRSDAYCHFLKYLLFFRYSLCEFLNELSPKKNWKLLNPAAKPLRIRRGFLAAEGGEMRSDYFKNTAP
ncbi:MAG: hypothetical protein Q8R13_02930, partial [bacterium]|nr:hypothetical protein [bacterium]